MSESHIEIADESTDKEKIFVLYIDGSRRGCVSNKGHAVTMKWEVYGPQNWPSAKVLLQGMLDLSVIADQLAGEVDVQTSKGD